MPNRFCFLEQIDSTSFILLIGIVVLLLLAFFIFFILCFDTQEKPSNATNNIAGNDNFNYGESEYNYKEKFVKTVYSDKTLDYSGTKFLPIPTRAPDDRFVYEFVGWDKNSVDENGNTVIRAVYLQKVVNCNVKVYDDDKTTLLANFNVDYGSSVNLDKIKPNKKETKEFSYKFVGWDKDVSSVYKDERVNAVYKATPKKYTYSFYEEDGKTLISSATAIYGTPIIAPATPKKQGNEDGIYEFAGWRGLEDNAILTKNIDYVATYKFKPFAVKEETQKVEKADNKAKVVLSEPKKIVEKKETNLKTEEPKKETSVKHKEELKKENKVEVVENQKVKGGLVQFSAKALVEEKKEQPAKTDKTNNSSVVKVNTKETKASEDGFFSNMLVNKLKISPKNNNDK